MTFQCYIKSHCEAPDFEMEVEAESKEEACDKILTYLNKHSEDHWTKDFIINYIERI